MQSTRKIVLTFGLVAGAVMSAMMLLMLPMMKRADFDNGEVIGYATMVAASLAIYFGVRRYRDEIAGGVVSFGRALAVGVGISMVAAACYTATWEVIYYKLAPDFGEKYGAHQIEKARAGGASDAQIAKMQADMKQFAERYRNPVFNSAVTFLEPLPVELLVALISAGVLRRKRRGDVGGAELASAL